MNCVALFNSITHDEGVVNEKILNKLLNKFFYQYLFLKDLIKKDMKIKSKLENDNLVYYIKTDNDDIKNELLESNGKKIKYKKKKYVINVLLESKKIKLYFSK